MWLLMLAWVPYTSSCPVEQGMIAIEVAVVVSLLCMAAGCVVQFQFWVTVNTPCFSPFYI